MCICLGCSNSLDNFCYFCCWHGCPYCGFSHYDSSSLVKSVFFSHQLWDYCMVAYIHFETFFVAVILSVIINYYT